MGTKGRVFAGVSVSIVAAAAVFIMSAQFAGPSPADKAEAVSRGKYLVRIGGCHDCHTPKIFTEKGPIPDESRLLSGHPSGEPLPALSADMVQPGGWVLMNSHLTAAAGPWGVSYAANLTPDLETGMGRWTEEAFVQSMRTGLHWGVGPPILPPMPWQNFGEMTDEDLRAVFAYLQSIQPVHNDVPAPVEFGSLPK